MATSAYLQKRQVLHERLLTTFLLTLTITTPTTNSTFIHRATRQNNVATNEAQGLTNVHQVPADVECTAGENVRMVLVIDGTSRKMQDYNESLREIVRWFIQLEKTLKKKNGPNEEGVTVKTAVIGLASNPEATKGFDDPYPTDSELVLSPQDRIRHTWRAISRAEGMLDSVRRTNSKNVLKVVLLIIVRSPLFDNGADAPRLTHEVHDRPQIYFDPRAMEQTIAAAHTLKANGNATLFVILANKTPFPDGMRETDNEMEKIASPNAFYRIENLRVENILKTLNRVQGSICETVEKAETARYENERTQKQTSTTTPTETTKKQTSTTTPTETTQRQISTTPRIATKKPVRNGKSLWIISSILLAIFIAIAVAALYAIRAKRARRTKNTATIVRSRSVDRELQANVDERMGQSQIDRSDFGSSNRTKLTLAFSPAKSRSRKEKPAIAKAAKPRAIPAIGKGKIEQPVGKGEPSKKKKMRRRRSQ